MARCLLIAVSFHDGRYHGEGDGFDDAKGWPPSPARLFQAMVAAAARGDMIEQEDKKALRWLEGRPAPRIAAPPMHRGRAIKLFVPNNDLDAVGGDPANVGKIRVDKSWRPCFFDPDEPVIYAWKFDSGKDQAVRICTIAERLCQLGRGVDMAWAQGSVVDQDQAQVALEAHSGIVRVPGGIGEVPTPCSGTLDSLVNRYNGNRTRLRTEGAGRKQRQLFNQPPQALFSRIGYDVPTRHLHFELRTHRGGFAAQPLNSAFPLVVGLRDAAAARLADSMQKFAATIDKLVVGRNAGPADLARRIRIVPIPSVGAEHTDPSIRRLMIEVPAEFPLRLGDLRWAFAGLGIVGSSDGSLVSTDEHRMADRYCRKAIGFETITPAALPRAGRQRVGGSGRKSAQERQQEEHRAVGAVFQALRHAGVTDRPVSVHVQREPLQARGALAESFAQGSRFSKHALWHVALRFAKPVSGPLVIGDGRFSGLGLMEPVQEPADLFVFQVGKANRIPLDEGYALCRHLRRALMSRARDRAGRISRMFSGHASDGGPDRGGRHLHVFLAADSGPNLERPLLKRLIVAAPWVADRTATPNRCEAIHFDRVLRGIQILRAGHLGRLDNLVAESPDKNDPLVAPSREWTTVTRYVATRNLKKQDDLAAMMKADVARECARRGLPAPLAIEVSDLAAGPRGGKPAASIELHFAVAVRGPLMLGRDSHTGGGLFHGIRQ